VKKILVIQTAFLGDVILATPVLSELKRLFSEASVDILVRKGNQSLLANNPHLDQIHVFDKKKGKARSILPLIKQIRSLHYDLVINLHRFGSSGLITALSGAPRRYGFSKNPFSFFYTKKFDHSLDFHVHEVARNLSIISEFGAATSKRPELFPSDEDYQKATQIAGNRSYYCVAPASVWYTKQVPEHKWVELINQLNLIGTVFLLGGNDDRLLCERINGQTVDKSSINLAGALNFLTSAALLSKSLRNFVNDSGPLHLASAMNAPVTAFFCSTVPAFGFGPLSDDSSIQEVENLSCRPCGLHGHSACPKGHFKCGNELNMNLPAADET
jgi:ADP-heptose:LPS heptosyltransferase